MKRWLAAAGFVLASAAPVAAQSIVGEVALTGGATSESKTAQATQGRISADTPWLRLFGEASWARVTGEESDAFGGAYPYEPRLEAMEIYGERMFQRQGALAAVRAGRFRTPFGIYGTSDHGYGGFLRAPLIRYPGYWALANTFLEHGVNVVAGVPSLQGEYSIGRPADVGEDEEKRRGGTDHVMRAQAYRGDVIVGVSHIRTQPYQPERYAHGRAVFTGVDARWTRSGVQLRGEWLEGRPFDGMHTRGGYVDTLVHHRTMGPVTGVARVEMLDYAAGVRSRLAKRATLGARITAGRGVVAHVNAIHQRGSLEAHFRNAFDVGVTYTARFSR
jgi:hypothetical protein